LNQYKGKGGEVIDKHIKILQDIYQDIYQDVPQLIIINNQHPVQAEHHFKISRCYKTKLIMWKKHWKCYNYLLRPYHFYLQVIIKPFKKMEKKIEYIGMTLHINFCSRDIIQISVIEEYLSKSI